MYKISIVGFHNIVGQEEFEVIKDQASKDFEINEIFLFDSNIKKKEFVDFKDKKKIEVKHIDEILNHNIDIIFSCDINSVSSLVEKKVFDNAILVIDMTCFFQKYKCTNELEGENSNNISHSNIHILSSYKINSKNLMSQTKKHNIISIPLSVSTGIASILNPIKDYVKRVVVSTYQPISRLGDEGISALYGQTASILQQEDIEEEDDIFKNNKVIAFNALPEFNNTNSDYETEEEVNIKKEVDILLNKKINMSISSVMTPVLFGDSINMNIEFFDDIKDFNIPEVVAQICTNDNIALMNNDEENRAKFPTPFEIAYSDYMFIGKINKDKTVKNGINLWSTWGNIRYALALNAVNIIKSIINKKPA